MATSYTFQIRVIKNQIAACLREIAKGVKYFVDSLVVLEDQLEKLEVKQERKVMKVQTKTGSESHTTNWRSATVTVNGKPIYEVLKPLVKPEWELVGNKGNHGKWCISEYELPVGAKVKFVAKANGQDPKEFEFVVGEIKSVDVDGFTYGGGICGWIVSI
jgi:hypothetical protein